VGRMIPSAASWANSMNLGEATPWLWYRGILMFRLLSVTGNHGRPGIRSPADDGIGLGRSNLRELSGHVVFFSAEGLRLDHFNSKLGGLAVSCFLPLSPKLFSTVRSQPS